MMEDDSSSADYSGDRGCSEAQKAPMTTRPIRTYEVSVGGFPSRLYSARSAGQARAQSWRAYCSYDNSSTFKGFLKISKVRRVDDPPGVGERIMVAGLPATRVIGDGQYTHFMRDDSDQILLAHPMDVKPFAKATHPARDTADPAHSRGTQISPEV